MSLINTDGILADIVEKARTETANAPVEIEAAEESQVSTAEAEMREKVEKVVDLANNGFSGESLPETLTQEQMKALIEVANKYNPANVESKDTVGKTVRIYSSSTFSPPKAVLFGSGDGNKAYKALMSKKVREGMMEKRVTELLRNKFKDHHKYPRHVEASAKLLLALAAIARSVHVHGADQVDIRWVGEKCARNINPATCVLEVVTEHLSPLYQMGSYWLPAQGLSVSDYQALGMSIIKSIGAESTFSTSKSVQTSTT